MIEYLIPPSSSSIISGISCSIILEWTLQPSPVKHLVYLYVYRLVARVQRPPSLRGHRNATDDATVPADVLLPQACCELNAPDCDSKVGQAIAYYVHLTGQKIRALPSCAALLRNLRPSPHRVVGPRLRDSRSSRRSKIVSETLTRHMIPHLAARPR
jgi:hypothetical protein